MTFLVINQFAVTSNMALCGLIKLKRCTRKKCLPDLCIRNQTIKTRENDKQYPSIPRDNPQYPVNMASGKYKCRSFVLEIESQAIKTELMTINAFQYPPISANTVNNSKTWLLLKRGVGTLYTESKHSNHQNGNT